jgi:hypothetical protein
VARAVVAPSRARRSALALPFAARPWTTLTPAPEDGHTHEARAAQGAQVTDFVYARSRILEGEATDFGRCRVADFGWGRRRKLAAEKVTDFEKERGGGSEERSYKKGIGYVAVPAVCLSEGGAASGVCLTRTITS